MDTWKEEKIAEFNRLIRGIESNLQSIQSLKRKQPLDGDVGTFEEAIQEVIDVQKRLLKEYA